MPKAAVRAELPLQLDSWASLLQEYLLKDYSISCFIFFIILQLDLAGPWQKLFASPWGIEGNWQIDICYFIGVI